jgi:ADP-ribose pyrophosphatase
MRKVLPKKYRLLPNNAQKVFEGMIYDVYQWPQEIFDGSMHTYEMLKRPDTVRTIAINDNKVIVLDQEQPNVGRFYDFPGGRNDEGDEDEFQAAQREMIEETGMMFKNWRLIDVHQPTLMMDYFVYTFLATDFDGTVEQKLDAGEKITVQEVDFDEMKRLMNSDMGRFSGFGFIDKLNSLEELLSMPSYNSGDEYVN